MSSYLILYSFLIVGISAFSGVVASRYKFTHRQLQFGISTVAGLMLGVAVFHFIPHSGEYLNSLDVLVRFLLAGMLLIFFLERFFCFHHHDLPEHSHLEQVDNHSCCHSVEKSKGSCDDHDHVSGDVGCHALSWSGVIVGLTIHSFFDGVALASGVLAESLHHGSGVEGEHHVLPGFAAFLAIALHKPFEALTIGALMSNSGESVSKKILVSLLFALVVPMGAFAFSLFSFGDYSSFAIGAAMAFSAGMFLLVALSDLIPELQFHSHDRLSLSFALLFGVFIAWFLEFVESAL